MGSEWNVKHEPNMEKLQHTYDEWKAEADEALEEGGVYSRRYQNVMYLLRIAERRLEAAQLREEKAAKQDKLTAKEIVDRMVDR